MVPYLILISVPIFFGIVHLYLNENRETKERFKPTLIFLMWLALFLMIALRSKYVGSTDSYNYINTWIKLSKTSWQNVYKFVENTQMEAGFCYVVWIASRLFSDPQWLFVLTGLLFSSAVCHFIHKHCEDMVLAFVMYVTLGLYTFMIQGMRQAIAMSIVLFAIDFCINRKLIGFIGLVVLATMFHKSAIVFLPVFFLYGLVIKKSTVLAFLAGAGVVIACSPFIIKIGNQLFDREYSDTFKSGGIIAVTIYILTILVALLLGQRKYKDKKFSFFFYMTFIGAVFYVMRYVGVDVAERVSYYFLFGQMFLLPGTINLLPGRERWGCKWAIYILCICLFLYRLNGSNLVPFEFFWQI